MFLALSFLKIALAIWGSFVVSTILVLFVSVKKIYWNFDKDCFESVHCFRQYDHFNINFSNL